MIKLKTCAGCGELKPIWKNHVGEKWCKTCWLKKQSTLFLNKPTQIKQKSDKRVELDKLYSKLRVIFLTKNPYCKAHLESCTSTATDIHHIYSGKNRSNYYLDESKWLSICRNCHDFIHTKLSSDEAISLGLKKTE